MYAPSANSGTTNAIFASSSRPYVESHSPRHADGKLHDPGALTWMTPLIVPATSSAATAPTAMFENRGTAFPASRQRAALASHRPSTSTASPPVQAAAAATWT